MFIFYSTSTQTENYVVTSPSDACKQCANSENLIVRKEVMTTKLFFFIPILRLKSYYLQCSKCGKARKISKTEGEALIVLSEHQKHERAKQLEAPAPMVFDEFSPAQTQTAEADPTAIRQIYVTRKKAFGGGAAQMIISINDQEVCRLKNGETKPFLAPVSECPITMVLSSGYCFSLATIPAGTEDLKYEASIQSGWNTSQIILTPITK